ALRVYLLAQRAEGVVNDRRICETPVCVAHHQCFPLWGLSRCSVSVIGAIQVYEPLAFGAVVYLPDVENRTADYLYEQPANNVMPLSTFACPAVCVVAARDGASGHHPLCKAVRRGCDCLCLELGVR